MQTFLASRDLVENFFLLDNRRLGKQRVECLQILKALRGETKGWRNHPATLMWHGYEEGLSIYMDCCIREWVNRGFNNTIEYNFPISRTFLGDSKPHWWDDERVFASHRSNLLRKDPEFYGKYGWWEKPDLPYFWPVTKDEVELKRVLEFCS